jgi:hypothetical protein
MADITETEIRGVTVKLAVMIICSTVTICTTVLVAFGGLEKRIALLEYKMSEVQRWQTESDNEAGLAPVRGEQIVFIEPKKLMSLNLKKKK